MNNSEYKVLIVDDVPKNIQILGSILMKEGYNISFASNGYDALKISKQSDLDLILLDVMMPGIDGFETCKILKSDPETSSIPVIFMTALHEMENKVTAFDAGAVDYITKPYEPQEVLLRVRTQIKITSLQKQLNKNISELKIKNELIQRIFGRYLSDDIVKNILEDPENIDFKGVAKNISILIADIRGFSSITEKLDARSTLTIVNTFFSSMIDLVVKYGGIIDELMGDSLLVFFGALNNEGSQADYAVASAIEMINKVPEINRILIEQNLPEISLGVGINSGEVIIGNIGSEKRSKFGAVGKNIVIASRIESFTTGNQIYISSSTLKDLKSKAGIRSSLNVSLKGVSGDTEIYDIDSISGLFNLKVVREVSNPVKKVLNATVSIRILDGKILRSNSSEGSIISIDGNSCLLKTSMLISLHDNLKLENISQAGDKNEVYAKVTQIENNGIYKLIFTTPFEFLLNFNE
ncbi:MAG: response regulator [Ignavibacteriaceae bacterium]|nr:response regulator [Ignavibacteriaceae bacterium]